MDPYYNGNYDTLYPEKFIHNDKLH
jgi:hypothetical protein